MEPLLRRGFVYFITGEPSDYPIKIGVARNSIEQRLAALQTASPFKLRILKAIPSTNPYGLESLLHEKFSSQRLEGEWFSRSLELVAFIENPDVTVLNSVPALPCLPDPPLPQPPPPPEPVLPQVPPQVRVELIYSPSKLRFVHPDELAEKPLKKCERCLCCDPEKQDGRLCVSCLNRWVGKDNPCKLRRSQ